MDKRTDNTFETNQRNTQCILFALRAKHCVAVLPFHLIRPQTWREVIDIESNELAAVEDTERGFAPSTQHIHLTPLLWREFSMPSLRESRGVFWHAHGLIVNYLCQAKMENSSRPGHGCRSFNSTVRAAINRIAPSFDNKPALTHPIELAHLEFSIFLSWLKGCRERFYLHYTW
jgi:hypothetical protein